MVEKISREHLPCPFCGSYKIVVYANAFRWPYNCICECQKCHMQTGGKKTIEEAIAEWNTRSQRVAKAKPIHRMSERRISV